MTGNTAVNRQARMTEFKKYAREQYDKGWMAGHPDGAMAFTDEDIKKREMHLQFLFTEWVKGMDSFDALKLAHFFGYEHGENDYLRTE